VSSAPESAARFSSDSWLSESLGRPAFRLASAASAGQVGVIAAEMVRLANRADAFFYAKLPTMDVPACVALVNAGFAVIDTGITFAWNGAEQRAADGVRVGIARQHQYASLPKIAETCFRWSRFHLDPQIPVGLANLIKRRWIESYVEGRRGSALYVAEVDNTVAGFLAVLEATSQSRTVAVIDLIGVASEHQGRGVGAALVRSFVNDWQGRAAELRVGTQAANIQSLRFYETSGFRVVESNYVLHAHVRRGEIYR
jgi:ribosomal protein S18 acetylase RimI-like enzyme